MRPGKRSARAAAALLLGVAGCASDPYAGYQPVPAAELARMVPGNSLLLDRTADWPFQTLLYFAPGGSGWRDARLPPGSDPQPGAMAMIIAWQASDADGLCLWSTPLIGEMPSFTPPHRECLRMLRAPAAPETLVATATDAQRSITAPLWLRGGSAFPLERIAQYDLQVRVLYGGQIPAWRVP
jgi:hypothetical protein